MISSYFIQKRPPVHHGFCFWGTDWVMVRVRQIQQLAKAILRGLGRGKRVASPWPGFKDFSMTYGYTFWLLNVAMENSPFISIY